MNLQKRYYINFIRHKDIFSWNQLIDELFRSGKIDLSTKKFVKFIIPQKDKIKPWETENMDSDETPHQQTFFIARLIVDLLNTEYKNPYIINFRSLEARICRYLETFGYRVIAQALYGSFPILVNLSAFPRYVAIQVRKSMASINDDWKRLSSVIRSITNEYVEAIFIVLKPLRINIREEKKYASRSWIVIYFNVHYGWRYIPRKKW